MVLEEIRKVGVGLTLDLEDLKLLQEVLLSFDAEERHWEPMKRVAFDAMGAAFYAATVACQHMLG